MKNNPSLSISQMPKQWTDYPLNIKNRLSKLGVFGIAGNFENDRELTIKEIEKVASICSEVNGKLTEYHQWFCTSVKGWRLCLGYTK